jgi:hypothetical protein
LAVPTAYVLFDPTAVSSLSIASPGRSMAPATATPSKFTWDGNDAMEEAGHGWAELQDDDGSRR